MKIMTECNMIVKMQANFLNKYLVHFYPMDLAMFTSWVGVSKLITSR